ncbi:hypothetical protein B0H10DRAFT_2235425 [Mycena sp. CBHHK59/15]|nr:hypothetical protein B0H10DRAFT_2235425 [Mycena sp. CBHHK59/15]
MSEPLHNLHVAYQILERNFLQAVEQHQAAFPPSEYGTLQQSIIAMSGGLLSYPHWWATSVDYANGLFQLDPNVASRSKALPEIEQQPSRSPRPLLSSIMSSGHVNIVDTTPSLPAAHPRRHAAPAHPTCASLTQSPPSASSSRCTPSHSGLDAPHSPAPTSWLLSSSTSSTSEIPTAYFTPPHTPKAFGFAPPLTMHHGFLFLGPKLTTPAHAAELHTLGVHRILNVAAECNDDHGLRLHEVFECYVKIPMRAPSRPSWCTSSMRTTGRSRNIGFVSELMMFEEEELGGKGIGVQPGADGGDPSGGGHQTASQPAGDAVGTLEDFGAVLFSRGALSAGFDGPGHVVMGDAGQEMECTTRRALLPHACVSVDENTLQPLRRVSKVGLESSAYL